MTWTGTVLGDPFGVTLEAMAAAGGTTGLCTEDTCDEFALKVLDPGARLQVVVTGGGTENDWVAVEVEAPDGATTFVYEGDTEVTAQVMDPAAGDYVVRVVASPTDSPLGVDYSATATLLGAVGPTPTPSATASATATATPTPSATATPTATPSGTPPPPPRTLALRADRRKLATAVRRGVRARTRCAGGCSRTEVRAFVSPLTARRLRIADQRATDVQVAAAPVAVGEGRKIHTLRFPSKLRKRLLRMKRLDLAIEATVTDPDGRRRTATDRITLGR